MKKDLLKMNDLSKEEILDVLNLADQLKYEQKHGIPHTHLKGKSLGMIFEKSSTRTRVSFEVGMYQLGGNPLFLSSSDLQIGRGEPIYDTARVLSRYLDGIMIRTFEQEEVDTLAKYSSIPIINGLTDDEHPCQILADLMTIREYKNSFDGLNVCYIGDGNNMANSLLVGCLKVGMNFSIASPKDYSLKEEYITLGNKISEENNTSFKMTNDPKEAIKNSDIVITDVWASMGQESESAKRIKDFEGYCVNSTLMNLANKDAIVLHCLPVHREEEISAEVFEKHSPSIFDEAENRLHAQKAILVKLLS
ncbi:MAG: ornithine carbamoyltransferase [Clostridium sp.]|uniref:ornithine carbamoyltransferase n=1 Tax=Clostridium sp. TaxID=1506 RepID=UPI003EE70954